VLRLLLDEHLSPLIARQLRARHPEIAILSIQEWENGAYRQAEDARLLAAAAAQQLTLVTSDQRTIMPMLKDWGNRGVDHGGVIFVVGRRFGRRDTGTLITAIIGLWHDAGDMDWTNRVAYLAIPRVSP
jgi:hypothetical protein